LECPEAVALAVGDQPLEQRPAYPAALRGRADVDTQIRDAFVAAAVGVAGERDPADDAPTLHGDEAVLGQVRGVPLLPARHLGLEGRVAGRDPRRVDPRDLRP